jgi:hydrogenase nickel incorporation protein HypA/HybF
MHEYSLAQALVERVEREARAREASAVHRVTVRIGPLSGVEPDLLVTAYGHLRMGTLCAGAELALAGEDVVWRCEAETARTLIGLLGDGTKRFRELRRIVAGISQRMLASRARGAKLSRKLRL